MKKFYFLFFLTPLLHAANEDLFSQLESELPVNESANDDWLMPAPGTLKKSSFESGDLDMTVRDFYRRRHPVVVKKIPESEIGERIFWKKDEVILELKIPRGLYSIIRYGEKDAGFHIKYLGTLTSDGEKGTINIAYAEIRPGDAIVKELFDSVIPTSRAPGITVPEKKHTLAKVFSFIEPDHDEITFFSGTRQLIAAQFIRYVGGNSTTLGALFNIVRKGEKIGKAIVVDADLDLATLYIMNSNREIRNGDELTVFQ